jgi:hypothetical protein
VRLRGLIFVLFASAIYGVEPFSAGELARLPTEERVRALVSESAARGWGSAVPTLRKAAFDAYETNSAYTSAWYYLFRWAELLATPHDRAIDGWIKAVEAAGVGHRNMPSRYEVKPGSLSARVSNELQQRLLGNPAVSEEFFSTLNAVDNPVEVLTTLQTIFAKEPGLFQEYVNLAIAIAVVYDVPPPEQWPHGQVSSALLPRKLPAPEVAFGYWARLDRVNGSMQRLRRLPASELKFVVDNVAPFSELDWARKQVSVEWMNFAKVYDLVSYRQDRLQRNQYAWPGADYRLERILAEGGICVDQAYFASVAGKAKGIPTLLFRGSGLDGRHAWFGFLDHQQRWQLDAGRYAEQKFVVGYAYDPQTWGNLNDHEVMFISERFRSLPTYKLSVLHTLFAREYLRDNQSTLALKAAREAVNRERRNLQAWHVLLHAQQLAAPEDLRARETVLREALLVFQKYPDLENAFSKQLGELLRARGETSLATFEAQRLAQKYHAGRSDLSVERAAETLKSSVQEHDLAAQIRTYNRLLETSGKGGGIDFFDKVVTPFALHLAREGQIPAAIQAVERARGALRVDSGKQLEIELNELVAQLRTGKLK